MKTILFPGQGSQVRGMGGALFDEFPELTRRASEILGYSISELCLQDTRCELNRTKFTQPAVFVVNALSWLKRRKREGRTADMFAGHSLGEYNALMAAGCFDFEVGLQLVKKRAELMDEPPAGAMAAIMNASRDHIATVLRDHAASGVEIVIHNSATQHVIAGLKEELAGVEPHFRDGQTVYYPLNTSGAFHSRHMRPVCDTFREYLSRFTLSAPQRPVIANVTGRPYGEGEVVSLLVDQLVRPVLWFESMQYALAIDGMEFEEVGHGEVLTKLMKWIRDQVPRRVPDAGSQAPQVHAQVQVHAQARIAAEDASSRHDRATERRQAAAARADAWNRAYPVGTKVRTSFVPGQDLATRTPALVLFEHRAAVYLEGYNGYFDLEQVNVVPGARLETTS